MTLSLFSERDASILDREVAAGAIATSPTAYDMEQFYKNGTFVGGSSGGNTFTVPAGLSLGFRMDVAADPVAAGAVVLAFNGAYTVVAAAELGAAPFTIPPGGVLRFEVITATRILVWASAGAAPTAGLTVVANRTALAAIAALDRADGQLALVLSDNSFWRFEAASALAADARAAVAVTAAMIVLVPAAGTGRWIRADKSFILRMPIDFSLADAAILCTLPAGVAMRMTSMPYWDVITGWTGGMASTIGVSSSNVGGYTVKGDLLGGAAGDAAATLVAGQIPGTVGDEFSDADTANTSLAELQTLLWRAGETIRYDEITSAFTAGAGMVCIPVAIDTEAGVIVS